MPHWQHWYEVVEDDELRQGDILRNLLCFWLPSDLPVLDGDPGQGYELPVEWRRDTRIILTASCDLDARAVDHVLLAPVATADPPTLKADPGKEYERRLEALRRDLLPRMFMLSEYPDIDPQFLRSFVAWGRLVLLPTAYVRSQCEGPRLRLRSPYREKLGVWVGARMSAVGPEDVTQIPPGGQRVYEKHLLDADDALGG
jgi:hypothetical protein